MNTQLVLKISAASKSWALQKSAVLMLVRYVGEKEHVGKVVSWWFNGERKSTLRSPKLGQPKIMWNPENIDSGHQNLVIKSCLEMHILHRLIGISSSQSVNLTFRYFKQMLINGILLRNRVYDDSLDGKWISLSFYCWHWEASDFTYDSCTWNGYI